MEKAICFEFKDSNLHVKKHIQAFISVVRHTYLPVFATLYSKTASTVLICCDVQIKYVLIAHGLLTK